MGAPFARMLLATEHTEFDAGAETLAMALARHCALPLTAVLPIVSNPEFEAAAPELAARSDAQASQRREALLALARAQQVRLDVAVRHGSEPDVEIVQEAQQRQADLVVIRRRGERGFLARLLVGEMVSKVVAHAPCSVLVAPRKAQLWTRRVLVGIDPQAPSEATLGLAAGIAADCAVPLRVVCVVSTDAFRPSAEPVLAALLHKARAICPATDGELRSGRAHDGLVLAAAHGGADLLVVARQRDDGLRRLRIGSVAHKVIGMADCPVLVAVKRATPA
jgi:nucleotide-binding universal stress UspA family protein